MCARLFAKDIQQRLGLRPAAKHGKDPPSSARDCGSISFATVQSQSPVGQSMFQSDTVTVTESTMWSS